MLCFPCAQPCSNEDMYMYKYCLFFLTMRLIMLILEKIACWVVEPHFVSIHILIVQCYLLMSYRLFTAYHLKWSLESLTTSILLNIYGATQEYLLVITPTSWKILVHFSAIFNQIFPSFFFLLILRLWLLVQSRHLNYTVCPENGRNDSKECDDRIARHIHQWNGNAHYPWG